MTTRIVDATPGGERRRIAAGNAEFVDAEGYRWRVNAVPIAERGEGTAAVSLYFFSRRGVRRLDDVPAHWRELSWGELERLCARALLLAGDRLA